MEKKRDRVSTAQARPQEVTAQAPGGDSKSTGAAGGQNKGDQPNRTHPQDMDPEDMDRTMGALYVTSLPVGEPDDITFRMLRIMREVVLIAAANVSCARRVLSRYDIPTPLSPVRPTATPVAALADGDVALILESWMSAPSASELALIQAAIQRGHPVCSLPGPTLPIAALVASGMPADSFVYLGTLPPRPLELRGLLTEIAGERRTLVAIGSPQRLPASLADLNGLLGDRPLAVMAARDEGLDEMWRGTVLQALELADDLPKTGQCVLVIGGSREDTVQWGENRVRERILGCLSQGLGVKETSQHLAAKSGWPRRKVYDMAVEINQLPREDQVC